jgi:predicted RNase H-like nuclease (RuvC/YqgF family)
MTRTNAPRASETERKERRRAANRKSARKSRFRENVLMDELQKTVNDLGKHNQTLKSENDTFKEEITALQSLLACHAKSQQLVSSFEASIPCSFC